MTPSSASTYGVNVNIRGINLDMDQPRDIRFAEFEGNFLLVQAGHLECGLCLKQVNETREFIGDHKEDRIVTIIIFEPTLTDQELEISMASFSLFSNNTLFYFAADVYNEFSQLYDYYFTTNGNPLIILYDKEGGSIKRWDKLVSQEDIESAYQAYLNSLIQSENDGLGGTPGGGNYVANLFSNPIFQVFAILVITIILFMKSFSKNPNFSPDPSIVMDQMEF